MDRSTGGGDQSGCDGGGRRRDRDKSALPPSNDEIYNSCTAEPKARQRKGLDNLSVSSRPRVPSYVIGRDRGEEWPRVLRVSTVTPTLNDGTAIPLLNSHA